MGVVVFTPFVFIDTLDAAFIVLNGGDWSLVFNTLTRSLYVVWSMVLLAIGLNVIHRLSWFRSVVISIFYSAFGVLVNIIFIR